MKIEQRLWNTYRDDIHRFLISKGAAPDLANEIVQDTLVKAYERRDTLRDLTKMKSWLFSIARNKLIDAFRKTNRYDSFDERIHDAEINSNLESELNEDDSIASCLVSLIEQLPPEYRTAVAMADIDNQKQKTVAEALNLSLSGAKSRVQRGRIMLKERLFACCPLQFNASGRPIACEGNPSCGAPKPQSEAQLTPSNQ